MNEYHKELELGISLAKKAPKIPEWFKQKGFISFEKKDHSPVTLADLAKEAISPGFDISRRREFHNR